MRAILCLLSVPVLDAVARFCLYWSYTFAFLVQMHEVYAKYAVSFQASA